MWLCLRVIQTHYGAGLACAAAGCDVGRGQFCLAWDWIVTSAVPAAACCGGHCTRTLSLGFCPAHSCWCCVVWSALPAYCPHNSLPSSNAGAASLGSCPAHSCCCCVVKAVLPAYYPRNSSVQAPTSNAIHKAATVCFSRNRCGSSSSSSHRWLPSVHNPLQNLNIPTNDCTTAGQGPRTCTASPPPKSTTSQCQR